ncbi:hypothetical protein BJX61DRAFT_516073 [Aspergillus egyptiacus]|nr:hypothetical protein BJX61DRAFT_516073 [Aspergillus egyptiacus]
MMRSLRFGSGLVVARLPNGTWSAPSAIATGKLKARGHFGMETTEFVYVLNTNAAVEKFSQGKTFILGQGLSIAAGPFGRSAELAGESYQADIFAYCKTRTVFGGSTLEGATIGERADTNRKMYQTTVTPRQLLRGEVTLPPETYVLMKILHSPVLRPGSRYSTGSTVEKVARRVPQSSMATELPSEPVDLSRFIIPHFEITDCSDVQLPASLTSSPEHELSLLERDAEGSSVRSPSVIKAGDCTRSPESGGNGNSHDPLPF